ncbi:MAG: MutH/Sau3AI family endonuclease [Lachnospiraceae bacterium]|nr:MutH/Sau3AI family endonuclease [Lachnospiraceae bacterium]
MKFELNAREFSRTELIRRLEACLNKTLGEVDVQNVFDKTKSNPKVTGIAGDVVEQSILGYPADNRQQPDLIVDGEKTELKTTGIRYSKKEKNRYEAKEPMSITAVSPDKIVLETFETSNFWHKLERMLLVYYLYASSETVTAAEYADFPIKGYEFFEFDPADREILKNDWTTVRDFIRHLQEEYENYKDEYPRISHELRDSLLYIDTAPKWPNYPRFRLKRSVVTSIVQKHFGQSLEQLPGKYSSPDDLERKCRELTSLYYMDTVEELADKLHVDGGLDSKSIGEQLIVRMFGGHVKKLQKVELFSKIGMTAKTIVLTKAGLRTEDMKLFRIDFDEIMDRSLSFEESSFYEYFADLQMLCIVFKEPEPNSAFKENMFWGFKRLSFDQEFIETNVRLVWEKIRDLIFTDSLEDVIDIDKDSGMPRINAKTGTVRSAPNFPKSSEGVVFVRGDSKDSTVKPEVVNGIRMYRQYIWVKGSYIAECLSKKEFL